MKKKTYEILWKETRVTVSQIKKLQSNSLDAFHSTSDMCPNNDFLVVRDPEVLL